MTEITLIQNLTPAIFTTGGVDPLIDDIKKRVKEFSADVNTSSGRDAIKSFAFQIAKSKTALDNLGKECVADWKAKSKLVDAERARVWDALENLQKQARQPLTEWENQEKERVENLKQKVQETALPDILPNESIALKEILSKIEAIVIDETYGEMATMAVAQKERTVITLKGYIIAAEKQEADAVELEKLRQEAASRAQQEREEVIRKEAAERATREAEARAKAESEAAQRREQEAKMAAERKELELKLVAEQAQREKLEAEQRAERAVELERQRVAAESAKQAEEEAKREANKKHKASVHKRIIEALQCAGVSTAQAESALDAICQDKIPHIKITY